MAVHEDFAVRSRQGEQVTHPILEYGELALRIAGVRRVCDEHVGNAKRRNGDRELDDRNSGRTLRCERR